MDVNWRGIYPAATTQFNDDESLNIEGTMRHLEAMIEAGIDGLIMLGTVGENCSLDFEEKIELLTATVKHVGGRIPVLTGVAEYTTQLASKFAAAAQSAGVDGLMVLPAMVYNSDERETIHHFKTVAAASDLPIMIYNNPVSYKVDIQPATFASLADEEKFVAIKESSEDVRRLTDIYNECGDRFLLFSGVDDLALESHVLGAVGWISGLVNSFPQESRMLWDFAESGNYEKAREIYRWFTPLLHLDTHPKLVQYIKLTNQECGYGTELTRAPRLKLEGVEREEILAIIRKGIENRPALQKV
ncbi:MAG: dihydrodipicolinate synthase family protein [Planctomycetota bacterium]